MRIGTFCSVDTSGVARRGYASTHDYITLYVMSCSLPNKGECMK